MEKPLVNKKYKLQKMPGKGGWTYIVIKEITPDQRGKRGMVQVKGFIDDYELKTYNLMPMANGCMFLPVRAESTKPLPCTSPICSRIHANSLLSFSRITLIWRR